MIMSSSTDRADQGTRRVLKARLPSLAPNPTVHMRLDAVGVIDAVNVWRPVAELDECACEPSLNHSESSVGELKRHLPFRGFPGQGGKAIRHLVLHA